MSFVAGLGLTAFGRHDGATTLSLMGDAAAAALKDCGLLRGDIDGLITGYSTTLPHLMLATVFAERFGLTPNYAHAIQLGGATGAAMLMLGDLLIRTGAARQDGITSLLWAAGCAAAAWHNRDGARRWTAFTATAIGGMALAFLLKGNDEATAIALAGYAAAVSLVLRRSPLGGIALAAGGWLSVATAAAFDLLDDRGYWLARPFLTSASGGAALVCAAWFVFAWNWARMGMTDDAVAFDLRRNLARILGAVVTFAWVHVELQHTISLDVSTFLLVAYYAVTGVAAIGVGRARAIPPLRHVGLALAVFAAIKAMLATSALGIGWRVGGYLLAGAFLLGVAYWYRGKGSAAASPDRTFTPEEAPAP